MSLVSRPTLRWAAVIWSLVTPQRFIQYSTALRSERSSRSLSMNPRLSFRPAMADSAASRIHCRGCAAERPRRDRGGSGLRRSRQALGIAAAALMFAASGAARGEDPAVGLQPDVAFSDYPTLAVN